MHPSVKTVTPKDDYLLEVTFHNGEKGNLDMKPYLNFGIFSRIRNKDAFQKVRVVFDTIEWEAGADLDPEFVYRKCDKTNNSQRVEDNRSVCQGS